MYSDTEEIKSIIAAADAIQARLNKFEAREALTPDQEVAVRDAANYLRGLRRWQLAVLRKQFDPKYAEEMERLTKAGKGG